MNADKAITLPAPAQHVPIGRLRSRRERVLQTLCFEALGLVLVSPLFAGFAGASPGDSLLALAALSVAAVRTESGNG